METGADMAMPDDQPGHVPLADVLHRLAAELATLTWRAERIQDAAGAIAHGASVTSAASRDLQELDRLTQTLADLARLVRGLSECAPEAFVDSETITRNLALADLSRRLLDAEDALPRRTSEGSVSLF